MPKSALGYQVLAELPPGHDCMEVGLEVDAGPMDSYMADVGGSSLKWVRSPIQSTQHDAGRSSIRTLEMGSLGKPNRPAIKFVDGGVGAKLVLSQEREKASPVDGGSDPLSSHPIPIGGAIAWSLGSGSIHPTLLTKKSQPSEGAMVVSAMKEIGRM